MKEGWKTVRLGDIATYINGYAFKPIDWSDKGKPIIRIQNLTNKKANCNRCSRTDIPEKYVVKNGDVLISWSATLGVFEWDQEDAWLNQHIFKVVFDKVQIEKSFFKYVVEVSLEEMAKHTNGATMKHIRKGAFDNIQVPLPPLSEQEEIVTYLDTSFAKIDAIKANAEKELEEAKKLFTATLNEAMTPKEGWVEKTLGEIANVIHGKNQKEVECPKGLYPIYGSGGNIMGYANDFLCDEGTTILGRKGTIDKPQYIDCKFWNVDTAFGISAKDGHQNRFIYYICKNIDWKSKNTGTTLPSLTQSVVKNCIVYVPTVNLEKSIVTHLDALSEKVRQLQSNYEKISSECDALKQAILRDTFE